MSLATRIIAMFTVVLALFVGGCSSVPDTQFLKHAYVSQRAEFRNALGKVSDRRADAVIADLKRKSGGNLDILDRQVALEQVVAGAPLVLDNKVTLLLDGPETYKAMFAAMRLAKQTINVETYIIQDDEIGREFADILVEKRNAGLEVNLIYDSVGAFKTPAEFFDRLKKAGVRVLEFNPINPLDVKKDKRWKPNHRDHRKLLIVDGRIVFLGGINIDSVYSSSPSGGDSSGSSGGGSSGSGSSDPDRERKSGWRDTDVQIEGPVVADFQKMFFETWEKQHGPSLPRAPYFPKPAPAGRDIVRAIASTPDDTYSAMYLTLISAIMHAEKQVYLTNAYFVPDPQLVTALLEAAQRGVDVRLMLPGTIDSNAVGYAAHSHYAELLKGGIKIYERRGALLHAKTAVIDGVWSCVGSSNLDWRSAADNDEVNAIILGREFASRLVAAYALDQSQAEEILLENWRKRPVTDRIKEGFFRLMGRAL